MYYSAEAFYSYLKSKGPDSFYVRDFLEEVNEDKFTKRAVFRAHKKAMEAVKAREEEGEFSVWKWYRPWDVVPALANWRAPAGDFGVGIEIELGFDDFMEVHKLMDAVSKWRHITLDFEGGGAYPIEATFPPVRYSKFGSKSQACRYLKLVDGIANEHDHDDSVGTHINVSVGGRAFSDRPNRRTEVNYYLDYLSIEQQNKYFGRRPYGTIRTARTHYECKMFNSVTDWKVLRRYVDISIELVKLIESTRSITMASVVAACERGYNLH